MTDRVRVCEHSNEYDFGDQLPLLSCILCLGLHLQSLMRYKQTYSRCPT